MARRRPVKAAVGLLAGCPPEILDGDDPTWSDPVLYVEWLDRLGFPLDARTMVASGPTAFGPHRPSARWRRRHAAVQWAFATFGAGRDLHALRAAGLPV